MNETVYPLHAGGRTGTNAIGCLMMIPILSIPIAIWAFIAARRGRIVLADDHLAVTHFRTRRFYFEDVQRLGLLHVPIRAGGIGGYFARKKCGGDVGVNLCFMDRRGKTSTVLVSQFENADEIVERVAERVGKDYEETTLGMWGVVWPEKPSRSRGD